MFEEAADDGADADVSDSPGTPGRNMQTPRTMRSMSTPACGAWYIGDHLRFDQRIHLGDDAALAPAAGDLGLSPDGGDDVRLQRERRLPQVLQGARPASPVSCLNTSLTSLGDFVVGRHQAEVGVQAGGARMVVAGAEVGVALEAAFLAAHDEQRLGVGLVADDAVTTTWAPTCFSLVAQPMLASSSKRAINSTTTVTSLPFCARGSAIPSAPSRCRCGTVILIATTAGSVAAWLKVR